MIVGIQGGIGTGKTITLVWYLIQGHKRGKNLFTNISLKGLDNNYTHIKKDFLSTILARVKSKEIEITNAIIGIQEIHNYADSRSSMSLENRLISRFILMSRHIGEGSNKFIYDTQDVNQIDKRLRCNTDFLIQPTIIHRKQNIPSIISLDIVGKVGHKYKKFRKIINVDHIIGKYNTHEVLEL